MAEDALATRTNSLEALEQRLQRLEDAVASLQDTRPLEDRITQRVSERLQGRTDPFADKVVESRTPAAPPPPLPAPPAPPPGPSVARQPWLLFDALHGLWVSMRMFVDVRYHTAWPTRLTVVVLLVLILTSRIWIPFGMIPLVGFVLDKVVDLVLAFFVYKALSREALRYQQFRAARAFPEWRSR